MDKVRFIYNPYSGENSIVDKIDGIIEFYQSHNILVTPFRASQGFSLENAFLDLDESYIYILIAGGDGTLDWVINSMMKCGIELPIAIIPSGTANDFAKYIGMSMDLNRNLKQIIQGEVKDFDLGMVNDKYFVNVASAGLFTDVSQRTDVNLKNTLGNLAYYMKGLEQLQNFRKLNINIKSENTCFKGEMYMILVFNGQTAGNIKLAYKSCADDGLLDVIILKACPVIDVLGFFFNMMKGDHLEDENSVVYFKAKNLEINCEEAIVTDIDGERGPDFPLSIKCIKGGIKIIGSKM